MMRKFMAFAAAGFIAAGLAACANTSPAGVRALDLNYPQFAPVALNVARIEVIDNYRQPASGGNIENEFPVLPSVAAKNLIEKKLVAQGPEKILRVYIEDASVVGQRLPIREDFVGKLTREPVEKYRARVALRFELANDAAPDIAVGHATVISDRTTSLMENTSLGDRDRAYSDLTDQLMRDLYAGFTTIVQNTFGFK